MFWHKLRQWGGMMEENGFKNIRLSELEFTEDNSSFETKRPDVPLPDQDPKSPDLAHLPKEILRSGTVESLISQNEDLMARLKVNLRRMSLLEQELDQTKLDHSQLSTAFQALKDQVLIYREKDSMRSGEQRAYQEKLDELQKQLTLTERSYAELTETFSTKDRAQREEIGQLRYNLNRFLRYRARIHTFIKPSLRDISKARKDFTSQLQQLTQDLERKKSLIEGLREQINQISKNARLQSQSFEDLKLQLIESHDREKYRLSQENEALKNFEVEALRARERINALQDKETELQNALIRTQRAKESLAEKLAEQVRDLQLRLQDAKRLQTQAEFAETELRAENKVLTESRSALEVELQTKRDQLEQARLMWEKKNEELDKLKASNLALEKINLELSQDAKAHRELTKSLVEQCQTLKENLSGTGDDFDKAAQQESLNRIIQSLSS